MSTPTLNPPISTERNRWDMPTITNHIAHDGYALAPVREVEHVHVRIPSEDPTMQVHAQRYNDAFNPEPIERDVLVWGRLTLSPRDALALADAIRRAAEMLLPDKGAEANR